MKEAGMSTEKRQSPRVKANIPVRYRELREGAEAAGIGSLTTDVSTGGLRFGTNKFFSTACRLILEFDIPTLTNPIRAVSKVAWIQEADKGDECQYHVGSQFMEITEKDQALIAKYMKSL
jgi:hypothetical protein